MDNNYIPTTWVGGKTIGTADVMNNIEQGIGLAHDKLDALNLSVCNNNNVRNICIAPFFSSDSDTRLYLYKSYNGKKFYKSKKPIFDLNRDGDIFYRNGKFYLITTSLNHINAEFTIQVSENMVDWTRNDISIGLCDGVNVPYAPEWFIDENGDVYVFLAFSNGYSANQPSFRKFDNYLVKCSDLNLLTFEIPVKLGLNNWNLIDPHVIKKDGKYYMFVKTETDESEYKSGTIQIWTSNNLINWTLLLKEIPSLLSGKYEAPCIEKINNLYYLYIDNYGNDDFSHGSSHMHYCTSSDLINWSEPIKISCNYPTRHGSIRLINDFKAINILNNIEFIEENRAVYMDLVSPHTAHKYLKLFDVKFDKPYKNCVINFSLNDVQNDGFDSDFILKLRKESELIYVDFSEIYKKNVNIDVITCVHDNNNVSVYLATNEILYSTPSIVDINFTSIEADVNICYDNILINSIPGTLYYSKKSPFSTLDINTINLNSYSSGGVIDNLPLLPNNIYFATESISINSVDVSKLKSGDIIYFSLWHNSVSINLTLKNGGNIYCPGNVNYVLSKTTNSNELLSAFMCVGAGIRKIL